MEEMTPKPGCSDAEVIRQWLEEHDAHRDREDLVIIPKDALIIAVNALERVDKAGISRVQLILAGDAAREAIAQIAAVLSGGG